MEKAGRTFLSGEPKKNAKHRDSWVAPPSECEELKGYLKKRAKNKRWQKRYFEANDHYLTYYKSQTSERLLACIDLRQVSTIELGNTTPDSLPGEFHIELAGRVYVMKAASADEANKWVQGLKRRSQQPEAVSPQDITTSIENDPRRRGRSSTSASTSSASTDASNADRGLPKQSHTTDKQGLSADKLGVSRCHGCLNTCAMM